MSTDKSHPHDSHRAILKSTSIVSLGTFSSRVLGFVRDILLARFLGTGFVADAFFVAFRIPNLFREMLAEGAANAGVVPVLAQYTGAAKREEFVKVVNTLFFAFLIVLSSITFFGIVFSPVIVTMMAPGFIEEPGKIDLTIHLTRLMFPYLIFIGLTAFSVAVLYTLRMFVTAAFGPCLLNIAFIVGVFLSLRLPQPVYGLAISVLAGGVLQFIFQQIPLKSAGFPLFWPKTLKHPAVGKVGKLIIPRLFGAGIYQMSIMINTLCASLTTLVGSGGISAIYYADRLIQFPNGVFISSLASVVLPVLSAHAANGDDEKFNRTLIFSLKNVFFVMLPVAVIFLCLAEPIIRVLFERGKFTAYSTHITAQALQYYSLGLMAIGGIKVLVNAFYAEHDTVTPVKTAAACLMLNASLNFVLMRYLQIGGIALASSLAMTVNFLLLFSILNRRRKNLDVGLGNYVARVGASAMVMAPVMAWLWSESHSLGQWPRLVLVAGCGLAVFAAVGFVFKVDQIVQLVEKLSHRSPVTRSP